MADARGYDGFDFPLPDPAMPAPIPVSQAPPFRAEHCKAWATFWASVTGAGNQTSPTTLPRSKQLEKLVWDGIPTAFRGEVWQLLLDVPALRAAHAADHYERLVDPEAWASSAELAKVDSQIRKDVDRTWPNHRTLSHTALHRVLRAYARHVPEIGYCQGLSAVAASLLLLMREEAAFWSLVQLLERWCGRPDEFYGVTLWRCHAEQEVLRSLMRRRLPALCRRLRTERVEVEHFSTQWLLCLFCGTLPMEMMMRLWDVVCLHRPADPPSARRASAAGSSAAGAGAGAGGGASSPEPSDVLLAASLALLRRLETLLLRGDKGGGMGTNPATTCGSSLMCCQQMLAALQPGAAAEELMVSVWRNLAWLRRHARSVRTTRRGCVERVQAQLAAVAAGTMVPHGAFEAEESLLRPRPRLRLRLLRISRPQPRGADEPAAPGRGEGRSTSGKTTLVGRWRGRRRPPAKPGASDPAAEYTACATNAAGFNSLVKAASEML